MPDQSEIFTCPLPVPVAICLERSKPRAKLLIEAPLKQLRPDCQETEQTGLMGGGIFSSLHHSKLMTLDISLLSFSVDEGIKAARHATEGGKEAG